MGTSDDRGARRSDDFYPPLVSNIDMDEIANRPDELTDEEAYAMKDFERRSEEESRRRKRRKMTNK